MMSKRKKNKKIRTDFKQRYDDRTRQNDLTREFNDSDHETTESHERISGKGKLARKRTIRGEEVESDEGTEIILEIDDLCRPGLVLSVHGLNSFVEAENGDVFKCATRKLLKTISTDQRHIVVAGDNIQFRPQADGTKEGLIVRVEPRFGTISRTSRKKQHVIAANIEQMLIVTSAAMPELKPHLIDRLLVTAEKSRIKPIICINKSDLVDPADFQPIVGGFSQLGYRTMMVSAETGRSIDVLRDILKEKKSVVVGQSGVGKSSLLNAIQPGLGLRVGRVSEENQKGKHTTTAAKLIELSFGGHIVDTPGIRQFELWDVISGEIAGFFRELRPFTDRCKFPNCTHTHESDCLVKNAVADGDLDIRRYESYCLLVEECDENDKRQTQN